MKTTTKSVLITIASSFLLVGCCTQRHAATTLWEYKVAYAEPGRDNAALIQFQQSLLNDFAKDGWVLVQQESGGAFIFKRAKK